MRFSTTISASLALLLRARLALGASVSIPTEELRGLDPIDIGVDDDLEPRDDVVMTSRPPPFFGGEVPGTSGIYFCDKDDSDYIAKIKKVTFSKSSALSVVSVVGNLTDTIEQGAKQRAQIYRDGTKIMDLEIDICEGRKIFGMSCPVQPHAFESTRDFMPHQTLLDLLDLPRGNYLARVNIETPEKKQVICLVMPMKL